MLTIVMYHYVRDLPRTRFPAIKGLLTDDFERQLDHVARRYEVVSLDAVARAARGGTSLPADACLLTFDDGLADHRETVLPRLVERGLTAAFFPAGRPAVERTLLDVHRVHFLLAASPDTAELRDRLVIELERLRADDPSLPTVAELEERYARPSRYDPAEVVFVKRVLQTGLAQPARSELARRLFAEVVGEDEHLADELYMDVDDLRELVAAGMAVGGHGWEHEWLGTLPAARQADEIARTVAFLELVHGTPPSDWTLCYPYGSFDAATIRLAAAHGAALGLTDRPGVVESLERPFALERLDTNDLPPRGTHQ